MDSQCSVPCIERDARLLPDTVVSSTPECDIHKLQRRTAALPSSCGEIKAGGRGGIQGQGTAKISRTVVIDVTELDPVSPS